MCNLCEVNPNLKETWGCVTKTRMSVPTFEEIENNTHFRYWNCPMKFMSDSIYKFFLVYNYYKDFPSAAMPSFSDVSARFFTAYKYYENKLCENRKFVMERG